MNKIISVAFLILIISSCSNEQTAPANQPKGEIIYHVFQRSFYDGNGDGQGDLVGLKSKLDYLQDLGVTSILLLPLYDADCYHNYFASDFEKIDPEFGTMKDYVELVKEVHRRGMKIYLDMETQYVSEKHLWWREAVGNPKSVYSNYILFEDEGHTRPATIIFDLRELNSFDGSKIKIATVNLKDKNVLDYNIKLFSYFADPDSNGKFDDGADGFRLDHAMDNLDNKPALTNLFSTFWLPLVERVKKVNPQLKFVAEQANWGDYGFEYFEKAGVDRMFGFGLQQAILSFNKQQLANKADTILRMTPAGKDQIIFIENHDIDRSASVLNKDPNKERVAAALSLLIGGIPSIYYGQELGMTGKGGFGIYGVTDGNDIPRREAFEWSKTDEGKGMALWYKNTGPWWDNSYLKANDGISFEEELPNENSLLNFYKTIIRLKQSNPALSTGKYAPAGNNNSQVFTFFRQEGLDKVLVAVNLSAEKQTAGLSATGGTYSPLYGNISINQNSFELKPYEIGVWLVK
jgi:alpha-amylase